MASGTMIPAMMGAFGIVIFLLIFILFAIWIFVPFSIFGIKDLIREAIEEQKKTNELLRDILKTRGQLEKRGERGAGEQNS